MKFREFYSDSSFEKYAESDGNFDLYIMTKPSGVQCLVSLAKDGSGCNDSYFGDFAHLDHLDKRGINHGYRRV